ncbi:hypothetical protein ATCC90586_002428 [Pythium insidiosum]|nr:hypothetical protein ATCC90586_002428 [Pythium insidiosum]
MTTNSTQLSGSVFNAGPMGSGLADNVTYGKLPPLNPDDLKPPSPPPSAAAKVTRSSEAISIGEVWEEIKTKLREMVVGSSVSGVLAAMRGINLGVAGCMIALAIAQILSSKSAFSVMSESLSIIYTIFFALLLIGYELRTLAVDSFLRENYGFMYNPWGRCLFLCMISIFPFGMVGVYGILVSLLGFANAYFNFFVITKHPSFTRGIPDYVPPAAADSALHVLTSRELFRQITCWMPGWPLALDEFMAERIAKDQGKKRRGARRASKSTPTRREQVLRALGGRTLPEAIIEELRGREEQDRAVQLLAMVHDLSLQSAVLRGKDSMSFERALPHALRHGAHSQVVRWLLDMQLHKRPHMPDGHQDEVAEWASLWCDAVTGLQHNDTATLDVLRECIRVDVTAHDALAEQVRDAVGRRDPDLSLLQWLRNEWPTLVIPHQVVDTAASQGKQDVVEWLCDDGASERFTQAALQGALDAQHYATEVRSQCESDGAEEAMVRAGREFKASVIRFLAREMGRVELEPWAMEGAVETQSVGWLHMIHEICGGLR